MIRRAFVWLHRWTGLLMTLFLILVGLTGSVLAFKNELDHLITPQLFAAPRPDAAPLGLATLAERAETLVPEGQVQYIYWREPDQAEAWVVLRQGAKAPLGFNELFLDPWTGKELGRRSWGDISQGSINLITFIYRLHFKLAMGRTGLWILGIVALAWAIDCFVGFYLTLPVGMTGFRQRWKPAWLIKWNAGTFRINFDLHRAGGLWLWAMLLIFAWSSVYMNLWDTVYTWATRAVLEYKTADTELPELDTPVEHPALGWREAEAVGERLAAEAAAMYGFQILQPVRLAYSARKGVYDYTVRSSFDVQNKRGRTQIFFEANTGALRLVVLPTGQYAGNTVTSWLYALHTAYVFGLPYRIFVCTLGLAITMISVTGVYIWWKKRRARKFSRALRTETTETKQADAVAAG